MRITLLLTGKTKAGFVKDGLEEYSSRIKRYIPFSFETIPDLKVTRKTAPAKVNELEGKQILRRIRKDDYAILLDEKGKIFDSEQFASYLEGLEGRTGSVVFVVGGAYGFSNEVRQRANETISLSRMTFSHQLVRIIFTEQLYRACSILKGEPYHH